MVSLPRPSLRRRLAGADGSAAAPPIRRPMFLETLSNGTFFGLWLSNGFAYMGMRVRDMAIAWLVLDMTDSSLWVGVVNGVPTISVVVMSLLGGVLADRIDRRLLLLWSRFSLGVLMYLTGFLISSGSVELWHLIAIAFVAVGVIGADMPIGRTMVLDIVGKDRLVNATSLSSLIMDVGGIVGPAIAGAIINNMGVDAVLYVLSVTYMAAFLALLATTSKSAIKKDNDSRVLHDLMEGFAYIRRTPKVAFIVALAATVPLAGVFFSMVPVYARDVLQIGAGGFGTLMAAYGLGALASSVILTIGGEIGRKSIVVILSALVYAAGMIGFAFSGSYEMAIVAVFITGMASTYWKNTTITMLQISVADAIRGRVMSVFGIGVQMLALGWLIGGVLATLVGPQTTLIIAGVLIAMLNGSVYVASKEVRQIA